MTPFLIFVYVVLRPNVLTVKGCGRLLVVMVTSPEVRSPLRGTPVVPALAHGPAVLVLYDVSPEAIAA